MAVKLEVILVLCKPYKIFVTTSTGTMCGVTWKSAARTCDPCAARKDPRKRTRGRLQLYNVGAPFERIAFDILGPLPRSSDINNSILMVMDYFTKLPEVYFISDQEASTIAEVLVQHWISQFGIPLIKGKTSILQFARYCVKYLPSTKPEQQPYILSLTMLFGRDLRPSVDLLFSRPADASLAPEEYVKKLQDWMEEMCHSARGRIGMASEKMKTRYDARATGHNFHEGDKVWLWNPKHYK
ncbi:retrovirus-related Pol polyprotein from transposon 412 [Trichonephila clavipes]|uniref:Retrovirus-related Pol polyprotein from transposon 412 n=1 Tax=Trichonephila clavipes TaxID=2585209 RepID=A0A8X6S864_TRICX|nr:retrovirus-related Pol polyprotein from transposon 412 [Trichonephila clavipes]